LLLVVAAVVDLEDLILVAVVVAQVVSSQELFQCLQEEPLE
jgi:hypothetical protein